MYNYYLPREVTEFPPEPDFQCFNIADKSNAQAL